MSNVKPGEQINNWKVENVLNLANHFHQYNSVSGQHERVVIFEMEAYHKDLVMNKIIAGQVKEIEIHLALIDATHQTNQLSFRTYMVMELTDLEGSKHWLNLWPAAIDPCGDEPYSDLVPKIFKDMVVKNWNQIDHHLIDDLFLAEKEGQMCRVHRFLICKDMIKYINEELMQEEDIMEAVAVYPGVDLNKFQDKSMISFTPVLGFRMAEKTRSVVPFGMKGCGGREILIEYSLPCPPTCECN